MLDELLTPTAKPELSVEELKRRTELVREAVTLHVLQKVLTTLLNQPRNEVRLKAQGLHKQVTPGEERGQRMVYQTVPSDAVLPQLFDLFQWAVEDASKKLRSIFLPTQASSDDARELKRELRDLVKAGNALCELDWDANQWLDYGFVQRFLKGYRFPTEVELGAMAEQVLEGVPEVGDPPEVW